MAPITTDEAGQTDPPKAGDAPAKAERLAFVNARLARLRKEAEALAQALRDAAEKEKH